MPFEDKKEKWPSQVTAIKAFESYVLRETSASLILLKNLKTMTGFGSSCGACKFLRRKCTSDCVFAPFFCYDEAATHFAAVHKVFGASNASRLLLLLPVQKRSEAAITISYEALARMQDPVYGCVAHIYALQQQVASLQEEIDILENQMANSHVVFAGCDNSSQAFPNKGIEFPLQHDIMKTQYCQFQLDNMLSSEGNATIYQSLDEQIGIEFPQVHGYLEDHLFDDSNPIPLESLVSGIDQEVLTNHPWFNYNLNIIN